MTIRYELFVFVAACILGDTSQLTVLFLGTHAGTNDKAKIEIWDVVDKGRSCDLRMSWVKPACCWRFAQGKFRKRARVA